jgi:hypothetical protein
MRHARNRFAWHRIHAATSAVALAAALAACGNGAGAAPATLSAAPSEAASATTGNSTPEPPASPSSVTIASTAYPYAWTFPADVVTSAPTLATSEWDGSSPCVAQDPCTDWIGMAGTPTAVDRHVWVFGTPTTLTLDEFATDVQRRIAEWRPCPAEPSTTRDVVLDGVPARLHAFVCTSEGGSDLHLRVFAIRDGVGLVIGMAKLNAGEDLPEAGETELLLQRLEEFRWMP